MATMSLQAAYDQARSYLEANRVDQAIGVAQHILAQLPENLEAHRILGEAYLAGRQFDQSEAAFSRVLHADPENIPAHVGLGITFERQGKLDRAVAEFEQALEVRPDMPELRSQLLRLYTDIWGSEGATLRLSRPGLARLYAKGHMLPQAIQEFRSVIDELPERFDARVGLAEALWRDGQEQAAVEVCEEILAERPDVLKANLLLGYIRLANSDPRGEAPWQLAQQLDPYQNVARALFESLPDQPGPELQIEAWDEAAWNERRAHEAERQRAAEALDLPPAAAVAAPAAAVAADDLFSDSWLDEPEPVAPGAPSAAAQAGGIGENDDFLASLLALNTPAVPIDEGSDLDSSSGVVPFSFDDFGADSPAPQAALAPEELDLSDLGLHVEPASTSAEPELTPFSLADLGLSEEEVAQFDAVNAPASAEPELTPFSLADLGLSEEEMAQFDAASTPASAEPELTPFSLADLGLSEEEVAQLNAAAPEPLAQPLADEPTFEPFSLEELGLSQDTIASLEASPVAPPVPPAAAAPSEPAMADFDPFDWNSIDPSGAAAEQSPVGNLDSDLSELTPFSLDDLDLSSVDDDSGSSMLPPSLQPFSLDDVPSVGSRAPLTNSLPPIDSDEPSDSSGAYSWQQPSAKRNTDFLRAEEPEAQRPSIFGKLRQAAAERPQEELPPLAPVSDEEVAASGYFSNDDVSLRPDDTTTGERFTGGFRLPRQEEPESVEATPSMPASGAEPELTPFSLEDLGLSPDEIAALTADQIAAPDAPKSSFGAEPELKPFSLADLGLSPEEIAALESAHAQDVAAEPAASSESELTPFSLEDLGLSPDEIAALESAHAQDVAAEPAASSESELTPFSLEDLGLSPDEIAALESAHAQDVAAEPAASSEPELTPFSLADLGLSPEEIAALESAHAQDVAAEPAASSEPELTPFSLADLGLSPEEIAALEAAEQGQNLPPATGDTIVPGWSKGEEPELTPFSLDDMGFDAPNASSQPELTPFSLDDMGFDAPNASSQPELTPFSLDDIEGNTGPGSEVDAGVQPFSLDDLGLGDFGAPADGSRELSLSAEELAGLDLGEFESFIGDSQGGSPPLAEDPAAAFERLMSLGQSRGYVDLTDIIAVVSDPEAEAERIEEIGWALHRAGVQIRDGDEVIDMEESEGEEAYAEHMGEATPAPATSDAEPDLTPFSLEELGLSPEEIAALGLSESIPAAAPEPNPVPAPAPEPEPAPSVSSGEQELTPFSLEELGLSPEEIAALGLGTAATAGAAAAATPEPPAQTTPTAPPANAEPELTPFSLADLGLSEEEIAQLNLTDAATPAPTPPASAEPELTPFSLADLGLSEEEIAQLNLAEASAEPPAADDMFDFGLADTAPVEKVTKRTEPRVEEPPPPANTADTGFAAEPLDNLDDIWQIAPPAPAPTPAPAPAPREEPARVVLPPASARPAAREQPAPTPAPAPRSREDSASGRTSTRTSTRNRDDDRFTRRESLTGRTAGVSRPSLPTRSFVDFLPSGDETLDSYLRELDATPGNFGLSMAIGRLSAQTGRPELMSMVYKGLIKAGYALDEVASELEELVDALADEQTQRQLYRLLGDAYSKQGRFREAMAAYSYTFGR